MTELSDFKDSDLSMCNKNKIVSLFTLDALSYDNKEVDMAMGDFLKKQKDAEAWKYIYV